ncbi:MAG TPA: hypothetical protein VGY56_17245 [Verrucomicrobiae bacterium]|nr:hypothetical protein [Verrucomicrobiae bacterium]
MILYPDTGRLAGWWPKAGVFSLILALAAGGGCGKSQSSPPPTVSSAATNSTAVPVAAPTTQAITPTAAPAPSRSALTIPSTAGSAVTPLQMLNRAMVNWTMQHGRRPQSFEEFASTANITIPDPPPGKKYAFGGRGWIVLVNANQ